ncbi:unnamed protein product [Rotaria socialis]|uniref:Uncharacterized protein n=1 Tax=Rotaria socialis TaxID=392032 RepID=A0A817TWI2_9BILA|nr:unnamed protein product [Rotaria socialis]CAF3358112.1 unnamed protein product [Rotaria socialis]CAF3370365.1 unnamed protein product [Rotaria socialis]CAF3660974.1 unnamed protein product [Rotaria socialis]CAF3710976.1 unnamed protein product [Rotaria socialis]
MNHFVRLLLLFTPSLAALGLLGIAFATNWWTIPLERNIPTEDSLKQSSNDERIYSTLIRIPLSRGLLTECVAYRNVKVLISSAYDFRPELSRDQAAKLAHENCTVNQFTCETGFSIVRPLTRCIDRRQKCNRIVDCEDKSDEISCAENPNAHNNEFFNCPTGYSKCQDGKSCYRKAEQTCDGVFNCMDKSDEQNCNDEKCQQNKHVYCPREGTCARKENSKRCDGIVDCADNSDEENCSQCTSGSSGFPCDSKCFPVESKCDGVVHCSDLSDEIDCKEYTTTSNYQKKIYDNNQYCMEQRFDPFRFTPPNDSLIESYSNPTKRMSYVHLDYWLHLIVVYGIIGGLIFLLFAVLSLFFFGCCRRHCICVPFYFYGFGMLLAWLLISIALISFVLIWLFQKQNILDDETTLPLEIMIHERNPMLRHVEFFGLSFWLACGAALATFIGLLLSYCVCCTLGSARADDKEYEIMQMHNY